MSYRPEPVKPELDELMDRLEKEYGPRLNMTPTRAVLKVAIPVLDQIREERKSKS